MSSPSRSGSLVPAGGRRRSPARFWRSLCLILLFLPGLRPVWAAVNDLFPSGHVPAQPGATTFTLQAYERAQNGPYARGDRQADVDLSTSILALRLVHTLRIGETTVAGGFALPWVETESSSRGGAGQHARGLSDLRLGVTAWLINRPASAHYLTLGGVVVAPTGDYDERQTLNAGENRWKLTFVGGWQRDFGRRWIVELTPELAFHGDNDEYAGQRRLEQRMAYALTGYLRYRVSPAWHVHVGGQLNRGGATRLDGVDRNNPSNNDRVMAGVSWYLPQKQQLILRLARDTDLDHGFRTRREIALRYQVSF